MKQSIAFYCDGSSKPPPGKRGFGMMGVGIVGVSGPHRKEWSIPLGPGTNQLAEILAVREALKVLGDRPGTAVTVFSDSLYAIGVLTQHHTVKANYQAIVETQALIAECGSFQMAHVRGHSGDPLNELAHKLAIQAASSQDPSLLPPPPKPPKVSDQLREIADQIVVGKNYEIPPPEVIETEKPRREWGNDQIVMADDFDAPLSTGEEELWGLRKVEDYEAQIAHLENLIDQLVTALRLYSDPVNWQRRPELVDIKSGQPVPAIVIDKGHTARQALLTNHIPIADDPWKEPSEAFRKSLES